MGRRCAEQTESLDIREMRRTGKIPDGAQVLRVTLSDGTAIDVLLKPRTRGQFAGVRLYFCCPACQRGCEVVYVRFKRIACRQCQQLAYQSETATRMTRRVRRLQQLRERLGDCPDVSVLGPLPGKPKGMRWATYERDTIRLLERTRAHLGAPNRRMTAFMTRYGKLLK